MLELSNHIVPFIGDPDIEASLSKPDIITPELLERGENIFLQVPEVRIEQWKPLITLIIQQFLGHCQRRPEGSSVPILFMLDEFPRFGKMEGILHGLATLQSKKVTICLVVQSLAQLDAIYGQEQRKVISDNCSYKAILRATDADTQEYFSKLVGTHEVEKVSINEPTGLFSDWNKSRSVSKEEKRIIRPEEFAYLDHDIVLLMPNWFGKVQKCYWSNMAGREQLA